MIRALVDFALNNRFVVIALALLALGWGAMAVCPDLPIPPWPRFERNKLQGTDSWPKSAI